MAAGLVSAAAVLLSVVVDLVSFAVDFSDLIEGFSVAAVLSLLVEDLSDAEVLSEEVDLSPFLDDLSEDLSDDLSEEALSLFVDGFSDAFSAETVTRERILLMVDVGTPAFERSSTLLYGRPSMIFFAVASPIPGISCSWAAVALLRSRAVGLSLATAASDA